MIEVFENFTMRNSICKIDRIYKNLRYVQTGVHLMHVFVTHSDFYFGGTH